MKTKKLILLAGTVIIFTVLFTFSSYKENEFQTTRYSECVKISQEHIYNTVELTRLETERDFISMGKEFYDRNPSKIPNDLKKKEESNNYLLNDAEQKWNNSDHLVKIRCITINWNKKSLWYYTFVISSILVILLEIYLILYKIKE